MVGELTWRKRLLGLWLPLAVFLVVALFPFTWMAATSLKTNAELYNPKANPLTIQHPSLVHYIDLLKETNFLTWVANTMLVAVIATAISLLLGCMLAYPLARMRFHGAPLLAIAVAVTYLIPQTLLFVPMADLIGRMKLGNTLSAVIVAATVGIGQAIITESALSFLGLGFPPDVPTWGRLLYDAQNFLDLGPHWAIFPGLMIFLIVLSINYIGDGLRDALDPRKTQ